MGDTDVSLSSDFFAGPSTSGWGVDTVSYGHLRRVRDRPALWVEGFIGVFSDQRSGFAGRIDIRDFGVAMSYDINSQFEVFGSVVRTSIDTPRSGSRPDRPLAGW